jgi:mobilization protein bmgB
MATTMRINDLEQEAIRKKAIELNKRLVEAGKAPVKDSELVHAILIKSIKSAYLDSEYKIQIGLTESA